MAPRTTRKTAAKKAAPKKRTTRKTPPAKKVAASAARGAGKSAKGSADAKRKADAKKAREAQAKASQTTALRKLAPIAKEVNHKLKQALKEEAKADDYRASAALRLADAQDECKEAKIPFKAWCEENVDQHYDNCRKLAKIGHADDPLLALQDLRNKQAGYAQTSRDKKKAAITDGRKTSKADSAPKKRVNKLEAAETAVEQLNDNGKRNLAASIAKKQGQVIVSREEANRLADLKKNSKLDTAKDAFEDLSGTDRAKLLAWAAKLQGVELVMKDKPKKAKKSDDDLQIPEHLDRRKTRRTSRATA